MNIREVACWATRLAVATIAACGGDSVTQTTDTQSSADGAPSSAPTIAFTAPAEGVVVASGAAVSIAVSVADDGPAEALTVVLRDDRQSVPLRSGAPAADGTFAVDRSDLATGIHELTATVTDAGGLSATATRRLVINTTPTTPVVHIEPATPDTEAELRVVIDTPASDVEQPTGIVYHYRWFADDAPTASQTEAVSPAQTSRGQVWRVVVRAFDGLVEGSPAEATVTIANAAPTCTLATLLPSSATTSQPLTCGCAGWKDADGDAPVDHCQFLVDGAPVRADDPSCTLAATLTERGTTVTCTYTPDDGAATAAPLTTAGVDIRNSPPAAPTAALAPDAGDAGTTFTCTAAAAAEDADGDTVVTRVAWLVNGAERPDATAPSVLAASLVDADGKGPRHGDTVACRVVASDGSADSAPATSAAVTLANAPPTLANVFVRAPDAALQEGESATCDLQGQADLDGDTLTATVTWTVDGQVVAGQTGTTLSSDYFTRGATVVCAAVVSDGVASSVSVGAKNSLTVANAAPTVASVGVGPSEVARAGKLTCTAAGVADPDGDTVTVSYTWAIDGVPIPGETGATLSAAGLEPGDVVTCAATASDGTTTGTAVTSSGSASVINASPTLGGALLGPDGATVDATLVCTPTSYADADGDAAQYTYRWTKNAVPVADATGATLTGAFAKGDRVRCWVRASDGLATTSEVVSNEVVIQNTAPVVGDVAVEPGSGGLCADFTCVAHGVVDADADVVTLAYTWQKNGIDAAGETGPVFLGALVSGDTLRCGVRPTDGALSGGSPVFGAAVQSELAFVANTPPTVAGVAVTPADAGVGDVVTCAPTGWSDDCTATPSFAYAWYVEGQLVAGQTGATLETVDYDLGDLVSCKATPVDAEGQGATQSSAAIALQKGDPTAPEVVVSSPEGAAVGVTCDIVKPERWFEAPTYTYFWTVDGGPELSTTTGVLTAGEANDCDLVTCRVEVKDATTTLSSEAATLQLPLFDGCEDGNDCTSHVCDPHGGCSTIIEDGTFCDDADPCSPTGVCDQGTCVAHGNVCYEEPANVAQAKPLFRPGLATAADGSYVTEWADGTSVFVRRTAPDDSRRDELIVRDTLPTQGCTSCIRGASNEAAVTLADDGRVVFGEWAGNTQNYGNATMTSYAHVVDADGSAIDDGALWSVAGTGAVSCILYTPDTLMRAIRVASTPTFVTAHRSWYQCPGSFGTTTGPITLVPAVGDYRGVGKTIVAGTDRTYTAIFDAASTPPDSSTVVVAWATPDVKSIKARFATWSAGEVTLGSAFDVSVGTTVVSDVFVAGLADGGFVAAWSRPGGNGVDTYYRRFDASGAAVGSELRANNKVAGDQRVGGVATFSDGGLVVVWDDTSDGAGMGVFGRLFSPGDAPEGDAFALNLRSVTGDQALPTVRTFPDDSGFVAAWVDNSATTSPQIVTRRFFRDGDPDPGVRASPVPYTTAGDQLAPSGAVGPDDKILVAFESAVYPGKESEIEARLFDRDGKPLGFDFDVNTTLAGAQRAPAVGAATNRFAVAWESVGQDGDLGGVYLQILDGKGAPVTGELRVNEATVGAQREAAMAMRSDGVFLVAWTGKETAGASSDIYAKVYDRDGNVLVTDTVVNEFKTNAQSSPAITVTKSGAFVIAWQSLNQNDQGLDDIFLRKLTLGANNVPTWGAELQGNTTVAGSQQHPTLSISQGAIAYLALCWESVPVGSSDRDVVCQILREQGAGFPVQRTEFTPHPFTTGTQQRPQAVHTTDGQLVVAWETAAGVDHSGTTIQYLRVPAAGPAIQLPRYLADRWQYDDQARPFVAAMHLDLGRVLIGWQSKAQDGSGSGVYMRAPFRLP